MYELSLETGKILRFFILSMGRHFNFNINVGADFVWEFEFRTLFFFPFNENFS